MIYSVSDIDAKTDEGRLLLCAISRLAVVGSRGDVPSSEQVLRELNESCERIFGDESFVSL